MMCGRINISGLFHSHFSLPAVLGFPDRALLIFFLCQRGQQSLDKKEGPSSERQCALNRNFVFVIPVLLPLQTSTSWRRAAALQVTFLACPVDGWEAGVLQKASTTSFADQGGPSSISASIFGI